MLDVQYIFLMHLLDICLTIIGISDLAAPLSRLFMEILLVLLMVHGSGPPYVCLYLYIGQRQDLH